MARPSAGFAPAGMLRARTRPSSISWASGGSRRRRPGTGRTGAPRPRPGAPSPICIDVDSSDSGGGGQKTARPLAGLIEQRQEDTRCPRRSTCGAWHRAPLQSFRYHRSIASTWSLSSLPAPPSPLLGLERDLELGLSRSRSDRVEPARHRVRHRPPVYIQTQSFERLPDVPYR